jgi:hypothetical protein
LEKIGFKPPEKLNLEWEKKLGDVVFIFSKEREDPKKPFLYNCRCHTTDGHRTSDSSSGFYSFQNLTREEVEKDRRFDQILGRGAYAASTPRR